VDAGMKFLMKNDRDVTDWKKLFDIIMVSADKPNFFLLGHDRPFRSFFFFQATITIVSSSIRSLIEICHFLIQFYFYNVRELNTTTGQIKWEPVTYFKPNHVYVEGSLSVHTNHFIQN
jgi:hypothetical protein